MNVNKGLKAMAGRHVIAITGKGGAGKTTIAAVIVDRLINKGKIPVLAVDADPNTGLDTVLGVTVQNTIGKIREEVRHLAGRGLAAGISKQQFIEMKIAESLIEADDFDLIAMGRPEGPGCYCYANNILKSVLGEISSQYPYVVIDNEAGLENLSRRIYQNVDCLILVTDPSHQGFTTVERLFHLTKEMGIQYNKLVIMVNRVRQNRRPERLQELAALTRADRVVVLPEDKELVLIAENGHSLRTLSVKNLFLKRIDEFLANIGLIRL